MQCLFPPPYIFMVRIDQLGTPWSDGVPGVSQRPIEPGSSFLYRWNANVYGSYFYHAHSRGQLMDGLYGAIYIEPLDSQERPFDIISGDAGDIQAMLQAEKMTNPLILSDWRHLTFEELWQAEKATGLDMPCVNSLLINGKGSVNCFDQELINQMTSPTIKSLLRGENLTDIACPPPGSINLEGTYGPVNYSAIPFGTFSGCKASQGQTEVFKIDPSSRYASWDIISASSTRFMTFSIDRHPLWVYAVDGRYIEPIEADAVTLFTGSRYSVLVNLDKPPGKYAMRVVDDGIQLVNATAVLSYETENLSLGTTTGVNLTIDDPYIDITGANTSANVAFLNESKIVPYPAEDVTTKKIDQTFILRISRQNNSYTWTLGSAIFPMALEKLNLPLLFDPSAITDNELKINTKNGTWVDIIIHSLDLSQPTHAIHKHSNKFYVIGSGTGVWNFTSVAEAMQSIPQNFNLVNPQIRDGFTIAGTHEEQSWLAIRYHVVNPGAFIIHCHIQPHFSGGMAMAILDGLDAWPAIPPEYELSNF
ncbi:hypothetical protein PENVUL_c042G09132 [Penicillium vulpinum]|uniref:Plastocyanin-like domain-containing protein n=1 Tax=Penicillium vulpinum TaxID=29845 RepID=A0A1V6RJL4_9EURO|nr:hypothetical protein PENVUL_c042G09132 [Penicillium vulpinum]